MCLILGIMKGVVLNGNGIMVIEWLFIGGVIDFRCVIVFFIFKFMENVKIVVFVCYGFSFWNEEG